MKYVINIPEKVNSRLRSFLGHGYALRDEDVKVIADAIYNGRTELEAFEWCTNCKEYDPEKHCCHRWTKVIRNTVNELSAAWQWAPVEDSPKRSGWYIVTKRFGNGETWIGTKWYSTAYGWNGDGILAWMELPEAYKEDKHELISEGVI